MHLGDPSAAFFVYIPSFNLIQLPYLCLYLYRCQHQRPKKRDRADEKAGFSIFPPPTMVEYRLDATRILNELR